MRMSIRIDSATEVEMKALQQAYHRTMRDVDAPGLWDYGTGIVVRCEGPVAYGAETPKVPGPHVQDMLLALHEKFTNLDTRIHPTPEERGEEPMPKDGLEDLADQVVSAIEAAVSDDWLPEDNAKDIVYDVLHRNLGSG